MDFVMDSRLVYCLQNGLPFGYGCIRPCWSGAALQNWENFPPDNSLCGCGIPDFTRGEWNVVRLQACIYNSGRGSGCYGEAKAFTAKLKSRGAKEWAEK